MLIQGIESMVRDFAWFLSNCWMDAVPRAGAMVGASPELHHSAIWSLRDSVYT